jgi:cytochrome oxidase Cu insertion factor (SCO1/SenC/PrrC family)
MNSWQWILVGLFGLVSTGQSLAQSAHLHHGDDNVEFAEASPRIGELIPDVSGYDEQGKEFSLRDLKDRYTVLVCGCLT